MKLKITAILALALTSFTAHADGFICDGLATKTHFKIFNHTEVRIGTRKAAVMVVSDPKISFGRSTIAKFTDVKNTLSNIGTTYKAIVDLRVSESNRSGENIAGTKLGELATINLMVYFNYHSDTPSVSGEKFEGKVEYLKRNGQHHSEAIACTRYLKM